LSSIPYTIKSKDEGTVMTG